MQWVNRAGPRRTCINLKPAPNPPTPVYISIKKNGNIYVGDFATDIDSLGDDLHKAVGRRDPTKERIFIRGDEEMLYQDFMRVMNKLQDNGFYSVALVGEDRRGINTKP